MERRGGADGRALPEGGTAVTRLVIDGRPLVGRRTGIGVHAAEIARRLQLGDVPLIASHAAISDRSGIEALRFRVDPSPLGVLWQQTKLGRVVEEEGDLLWGPHGTLPMNLKSRSVITIHDLTSLTLPFKHKLKTLASFNLLIAKSLEKATTIAAVSRATADELMRGFSVASNRITIIPNGVSDFYTTDDRRDALCASGTPRAPELPFALPRDSYLLYVGTVEPRKGVGDLIDAWTLLSTPRPRLVICGDLGWGYRSVLKKIEAHPQREEIIASGYLSNEQIRELYRGALAFVYPSHYEGFGLPPLEAMASGAPVVTTNGGAIPEVVGDAALRVAPGDVVALAAQITRLIESEALRHELRAAGIARAKMFTWQRSAELMTELIGA